MCVCVCVCVCDCVCMCGCVCECVSFILYPFCYCQRAALGSICSISKHLIIIISQTKSSPTILSALFSVTLLVFVSICLCVSGRPHIRARGGTCPPGKLTPIFNYYFLVFNKFLRTKALMILMIHKVKLRNLTLSKNKKISMKNTHVLNFLFCIFQALAKNLTVTIVFCPSCKNICGRPCCRLADLSSVRLLSGYPTSVRSDPYRYLRRRYIKSTLYIKLLIKCS